MSDVRAELEQQQAYDRPWQCYQATLAARMHAVVDARHALDRQEDGAGWALRQSLVDLAAVCELLAGELPQPRIPSRQVAPRGATRAV